MSDSWVHMARVLATARDLQGGAHKVLGKLGQALRTAGGGGSKSVLFHEWA